ncbi:MAG: tRNA-intron lyase [archaeon]|nr:tRNA-intron lyase [archaeon]MCR4323788.1 tRNA-intron lyase [Nanoarchaeota archaeon]
MNIKATLISEKVSSNSVEARNLFASQMFGEEVGEKIFYSLVEAFYLVEKGQMELLDFRDKKLSSSEISRRFESIDKKFKVKYIVFKDLRKRGYIVKTALKFGAEFRVYEKNSKHSKWILFPVSENNQMTWQDFSAKNRVAHSTKKNLLIAVVDEECDVSYYEVKWTQP